MLAAWLPAYAQADPGYKIGDRVEADPTGVPDGPYKQWRKGTVIDTVVGGYIVLFDGESPRRGAVINYNANSSRRINEKRVNVPAGCPRGAQTQAGMEAEASCWDAAAQRGAQPNPPPNAQPAPKAAARPQAAPPKTQTKTVAEYEAEAAAYEAEAARILAARGQQPGAQPRNPQQNGQQPGAVKTVVQAPHTGEFKVGDRVEIDENHFPAGYPAKVWLKGTVRKVWHPAAGAQTSYDVLIDYAPGTQARVRTVGSEPDAIRPIQGPDRNPNPVAQDGGGTCPASTSDAGEAGLGRTFHRIIREKFDRSDARGDARQTVTFQSFRVGAPIPWDGNAYANVGQPMQPVYATFTVCFEHSPQLEFTKYVNPYHCYQHGEGWECTLVPGDAEPVHWFGARH